MLPNMPCSNGFSRNVTARSGSRSASSPRNDGPGARLLHLLPQPLLRSGVRTADNTDPTHARKHGNDLSTGSASQPPLLLPVPA